MDIWILTIFIFWFYFSFPLFSWKDDEEGMWQGSHMTGHMMWCHKPRTWKNGLEDDIRTHGVHMVVLSKKWGGHEDGVWTIGQG